MRASTGLFLPALTLVSAVASGAMSAGGDGQGDDREVILAHVRGIFQAYLDGDRDAIRQAHTVDWTGFMGPSTRIERGIDDYMANADLSLAEFEGTGYEIFDSEVQIYGDVAIVYYVAEYRARRRQSGEAVVIPLRSIDIYRRDDSGWIQCGSHITPIPGRPSWLPPSE